MSPPALRQSKIANVQRRQLLPPKPTKAPLSFNESNRENLQNWLLSYYESSSFNTCTYQPLPMMEGPPLALSNDKPWRKTSRHSYTWYLSTGKMMLKQSWCDWTDSSGRAYDLVPQDGHQCQKEWKTMTYCWHTATQSITMLWERYTIHNRHSTKLILFLMERRKPYFNCWDEYTVVVPLHPDDCHFTTFITLWGRYRYKAAPQEYIASGDGYTRRFDEIIAHVPDKTKWNKFSPN